MPSNDHSRLRKLRTSATPVAKIQSRVVAARRRANDRKGEDRLSNQLVTEFERVARELSDLRELWDVVTNCLVSEEGLPPFIADRADSDAVDVAVLRVRVRAANLRGRHFRISYVDEGAFTDSSVFPYLVAPVQETRNGLIIAISSPGHEGTDVVAAIRGAKDPDDGRRIFDVYEMQFVCKPCQVNFERMRRCRHRILEVPRHKEVSRWRLLEFMFLMHGDRESLFTERAGLSFGRARGPLGGYMKDLLDAPRWVPRPGHEIVRVVTTIDPNWAGTLGGSYCGIVSMIYFSSGATSGAPLHAVLVGLDNECTDIEKSQRLLRAHVELLALRFPNARFFVVIERNLRGVPIVMAGALSKLEYIDFFKESEKLTEFGYEKRVQTFPSAMFQMQRCLIDGRMSIAQDLVCAGRGAFDTLDELVRQCTYYTTGVKKERWPSKPMDAPKAGDFDLAEAAITNFGIAHDVFHHIYPNPGAVGIVNPP